MAPNKKYLSLEEAAQELGLKPDELVRLREKGEVRGFADRGTWKFKADDIAEYHRSREPDSEPDIPILADYDDYDSRQDNVIRHGLDTKSDSDVRLVPSDDPRKKRLAGSSAEMVAIDFQKSDSDIRLVEQPPREARSKGPLKGSDSDVKIVKPKAVAETDSDSDVKMISKFSPKSDSDVKLKESRKSLPDSDSDVRMASSDSDVQMGSSDSDVRIAQSDSDVRMASLSGSSDSDVKLLGQTDPDAELDSDSDVKLLARKGRKDTAPIDLPLSTDEPIDFSVGSTDDESGFLLEPDDSGIKLGGDSGTRTILGSDIKRDSGTKAGTDSGFALAGDSGLPLAGDSGIRLSGDSGIRLQDDSGVQLIQPADSGISLEGMDSGVRFPDSGLTLGADSGIALGADSGIRLDGSSSKNVKSGGKKRKGDSDDDLMESDIDEIDATSPMLMPESDEISGEFNTSDTSELQAFSEEQSVLLFDEDEEDDIEVAPKGRAKQSIEDSLFEETNENLDELEVADDDFTDASEFGDLDFDGRDDDLGDSFSEGASQHDFVTPKKFEVAREVEWGAGFCGLLFASICVLIVGSIVSADLLRIVWAGGADSAVDPGMAWLLAGLWK